jgi:hypothetical protein
MGVRGFLWRRGGEAELAARLERRRERARPEFVNELAGEVRSAGRRFVPSRVLLAAALTFVMLVALASVGGSAGAGNDDDDDGGRAVVALIASDDDDDGDDDQYEEDEQECELALQQAHESFHEGSFTPREHRIYHQKLAEALEDCDGGDEDD